MRRSLLVGVVLVAGLLAALLVLSRGGAKQEAKPEPAAADAKGSDGERRAPPAARARPGDGDEDDVAAPNADEPPPEPPGVPAGEEINRQFRAARAAYVGAMRGCDARTARHRPGVYQGLRLQYVIVYQAGEGRLEDVEILDSKFMDKKLEACVQKKLEGLRWPTREPDGRMPHPMEDEVTFEQLL